MRVLVLAGKIAGAIVLFAFALLPVRLAIEVESLHLQGGWRAFWADLFIALICLSSLFFWWALHWRKALLWIAVPLFAGGVLSMPFWVFGFLIGALGD